MGQEWAVSTVWKEGPDKEMITIAVEALYSYDWFGGYLSRITVVLTDEWIGPFSIALANFCGGWNFKIGNPHLASHEGFMAGDITMAGPISEQTMR